MHHLHERDAGKLRSESRKDLDCHAVAKLKGVRAAAALLGD